MQIADLIQHTHTANRLQAASHALAACNASLKDETQVFQFAGANFSGADAFNIKHALLVALGKITDECENTLKAGGIEFPSLDPLGLAPLRPEHPDDAALAKKGGVI